MNSLRLVALGLFLLASPIAAGAEPAEEPKFADRPLSQWIAELDDSDALVREEAIEVLGRIGPEAKRSVPKLEKILANDTEPARRRAALAIWKIDGRSGPAKQLYSASLKESKGLPRLQAIEILKQLGAPASELAPYLIDLIVDVDYAVSNQATVLLQQFGKDGIPALGAALEKARGDPAFRLVTMVSNLGQNAKPLVPTLQKILKHSDARVRMACVRALWYMDEDRKGLVKLVVESANDKDLALKREAFQFALQVIPKPKEFEALYRDALKGPTKDIRYRAVQALWELDRKSLKGNLKILIDAVKDIGRDGYWYTAVQALNVIGPDAKEALPALLEALNSQNGINNAYTIVPAIARMGPDAVEPLVKNLASTNSQLQQTARQGLQSMGVAAVPKLLPLLNDSDRRIRIEVLTVLTSSGAIGKDAAPKLIELLKENDATVTSRALTLLGQLGPEAAEATPELVKQLAGGGKNPNELRLFIRTLGQIGPGAKAAVPELKKLMKHQQVLVQAEAAETLLRIDSSAKSDAVPVLVGLLRDKKPSLNVNVLPDLLLKNGVNASELMSLLQAYIKAQGPAKLPLVNALLIIRDPIKESAPLLRELLKDPNLNVRYEAACTLARLKEDGKEAIPELREMLKKPNTSWRDRAIAALAAFGPAAKEALPDLINQWRSAPTIDIQLRMAEPILAIDPEKGKPVVKWLRDQTSNGNVFYRLMALRQLAKHDAKNPDVLKSLLTMAHYPQPYYAGMALEVIGLLGPEAKSALPEVRAALKDADVGKRVRAAGALWRIEGKTEEAVPVLTAALKEHDAVAPGAFYSSVPRSGAIAAAVTLGEIGPAAKAALPALRHAMTLGDVGLRQNSLTAIAKIEKK